MEVLKACSSWWALLNEPIALGRSQLNSKLDCLFPAVRARANSVRREKPVCPQSESNRLGSRCSFWMLRVLTLSSALQHLQERTLLRVCEDQVPHFLSILTAVT